MLQVLFSIIVLVFSFQFAIGIVRSLLGISGNSTASNMPLIINRHGRRRPGSLATNAQIFRPAAGNTSEEPSTTSNHDASPTDVMAVKKMLMQAGKLPVELANLILDQAEYWACSSTTISYKHTQTGKLAVRGNTPNENSFLVRTEPLGLTFWSPDDGDAWRKESSPMELRAEYPRSKLETFCDDVDLILEHPCRKIVFDIRSHDQGWSSSSDPRGTFQHSWTWFEAGLERFEAGDGSTLTDNDPASEVTNIPVSALRPVWPPVYQENDSAEMKYKHILHASPDHKIQCNKLAVSQFQDYHVEWRWTDDTVPDSSGGDALDEAGRGRATGDGQFVREMKLGDVITVWGKARFNQWANNIERVEVRVYWAV